MPFFDTILSHQRVVQPKHVGLLVVTFGLASGLWGAWRIASRAIRTVRPPFLPGETNPALLATPFESGSEEDDLTDADEYDIVIVGGGTAGCVLASRLSEDPKLRVLLIEAGTSDLAVVNTRMPAGITRLMRSDIDYKLKTAAEPNMHNREMHWPRGKVLGGCSSINALMYIHGPASDYDEWAEKYGAHGWAWKDLEPYFRKAETFTPRSSWPVDSKRRGKSGPWQISYANWDSPLVKNFISGFNSIGVPTVPDINHGQSGMIGVTRVQTFVDSEGRRSSAATAYLTEEVCRRKNLKILVGVTITRIITHAVGGKPIAKGVEFASGPSDPIRYRIKATKDVVVACGAVHTPHLLMLSGIGPKEKLAQQSIKVVKDLPGVGANLQDHLLVPAMFSCTKGKSMANLRNPRVALRLFVWWLLQGTGALSSNFVEVAAFLRSHDDLDMVNKVDNLASSPQEPDMEFFTCPTWFPSMGLTPPPNDADYFSILHVPLRPSSVGSITLADNNPFTPPVIHANYFSTERDRLLSIWAFKKSCDIAKGTGAFISWGKPERADELSDDEILEYMKDVANTCYHPCSTAKIGAESDGGVVDPSLAVYGVPHLRVCDASVMPRIISGHTCAPVIAMAEKFADMLKSEHGTTKNR